jgi:hypothetical protein
MTSAAVVVSPPVAEMWTLPGASGTGDFSVYETHWFEGGSQIWSNFQTGVIYEVRVILQANGGFYFPEGFTGTVNGQTAVISDNTESRVTLSFTFPATDNIIRQISFAVPAPVAREYSESNIWNVPGLNNAMLTWDPDHRPFRGGTVYTVIATLTPWSSATFAAGSALSVRINGVEATIDSNTSTQVVVRHTFPATALLPITAAAVTIEAPVSGQVPAATATGTGYFGIGAVTWSPANNPFQPGGVYTASVTLTANDEYTFTGMNPAAASINGRPATIVSNTGNQLTLSYTFPETLLIGGFGINFNQLQDGAPTITVPAIRLTGTSAQTTTALTVQGDFTSIRWLFNGRVINSTNPVNGATISGTNGNILTVTTNAPSVFNAARVYYITLEVVRGGRTYSNLIAITVRP